MTERPKASPHRQLEAFIGEWDVRIVAGGLEISGGRTTFRWSDDESFVLQRHEGALSEDVPKEWRDNAPRFGNCVLGFDDGSGRFCQLYADSRGVFRIYQMSLANGRWELWRDNPGFSQRFVGEFTDDGRTIDARWETSEDGETWTVDFDLVYTRAT